MGELIYLIYCSCGELMKEEEITDEGIPVCWKCQCDSEEELQYKLKKRRK